VVEVQLKEVVFGQVGDVGVLDLRDVRRPQEADVHGGGYGSEVENETEGFYRSWIDGGSK
jgi:hypothetical protein